MSTEVWERLAHIAFALAVLVSPALFSGYAIESRPALVGLSAASAAPHAAALGLHAAPAVLDVSLATRDR
jgi:hypothetical protein